MRFHLICRVRNILGSIDTTPTIQADERIKADNATEAFIAWLASPDAWLRADDLDQRVLRATINRVKAGNSIHDEFESNTDGSDWEFSPDDLDFDLGLTALSFSGTACMGEFEFELTIKEFCDESEIDNGLSVRDPGGLSYDSLLNIVRFCQGVLFMDTADDRDGWTLDKDIAGSDVVDQITFMLGQHGLVPEEIKSGN